MATNSDFSNYYQTKKNIIGSDKIFKNFILKKLKSVNRDINIFLKSKLMDVHIGVQQHFLILNRCTPEVGNGSTQGNVDEDSANENVSEGSANEDESEGSDRVSETSEDGDETFEDSDPISEDYDEVFEDDDEQYQDDSELSEDGHYVSEDGDQVSEVGDQVFENGDQVDHVDEDNDEVSGDSANASGGSDHVAEDNDHVAEDNNHVAEDNDHVAEDNDHVAEDNNHVAEDNDHVAEDNDHVAEASDHVTEDNDHEAENDVSEGNEPSERESHEEPTSDGNKQPKRMKLIHALLLNDDFFGDFLMGMIKELDPKYRKFAKALHFDSVISTLHYIYVLNEHEGFNTPEFNDNPSANSYEPFYFYNPTNILYDEYDIVSDNITHRYMDKANVKKTIKTKIGKSIGKISRSHQDSLISNVKGSKRKRNSSSGDDQQNQNEIDMPHSSPKSQKTRICSSPGCSDMGNKKETTSENVDDPSAATNTPHLESSEREPSPDFRVFPSETSEEHPASTGDLQENSPTPSEAPSTLMNGLFAAVSSIRRQTELSEQVSSSSVDLPTTWNSEVQRESSVPFPSYPTKRNIMDLPSASTGAIPREPFVPYVSTSSSTLDQPCVSTSGSQQESIVSFETSFTLDYNENTLTPHASSSGVHQIRSHPRTKNDSSSDDSTDDLIIMTHINITFNDDNPSKSKKPIFNSGRPVIKKSSSKKAPIQKVLPTCTSNIGPCASMPNTLANDGEFLDGRNSPSNNENNDETNATSAYTNTLDNTVTDNVPSNTDLIEETPENVNDNTTTDQSEINPCASKERTEPKPKSVAIIAPVRRSTCCQNNPQNNETANNSNNEPFDQDAANLAFFLANVHSINDLPNLIRVRGPGNQYALQMRQPTPPEDDVNVDNLMYTFVEDISNYPSIEAEINLLDYGLHFNSITSADNIVFYQRTEDPNRCIALNDTYQEIVRNVLINLLDIANPERRVNPNNILLYQNSVNSRRQQTTNTEPPRTFVRSMRSPWQTLAYEYLRDNQEAENAQENQSNRNSRQSIPRRRTQNNSSANTRESSSSSSESISSRRSIAFDTASDTSDNNPELQPTNDFAIFQEQASSQYEPTRDNSGNDDSYSQREP